MPTLRRLMKLFTDRVFTSALQCVAWLLIAAGSWKEHPNGLFAWFSVVSLGFSLYIFKCEISARRLDSKSQR